MDIKSIVAVTALVAASGVQANGGISIDNVEQHMNADKWVSTQSVQPEIIVQGSIEVFTQYQASTQELVDTRKLRHSYDNQS